MQHQPNPRKLKRTKAPGVYRRGGSYVVIVRDPSGRQRKHAARTLAEARDLKAQLAADVSRGEYRAQARTTFAEYAQSWMQTYTGRTARGLRDTTRAEYVRAIEQRAIPYFRRRKLGEIEPRDVKEYAAHVAASGVAASTVRNAVAPLRALFATAVEEGVLRSNPATGVRLPRAAATEDAEPAAKALTEQELQALLAAAPPPWQLLFHFLADTGLRIGEALALRWQEIDFGRRRVLVRRRLYAGQYAPPKSKYGRRDVPVSPQLAQALWAQRKAAKGGDDAPVWPGKDGMPVDASTAYRAVRAAGKRAGVPWVGLHTLRHTCATRLFKAGLNAKQAQVWLGHHSPAFTLATYVHLLPDDLPEAPFGGNVGGNKGATSATDARLNAAPVEAVATA